MWINIGDSVYEVSEMMMNYSEVEEFRIVYVDNDSFLAKLYHSSNLNRTTNVTISMSKEEYKDSFENQKILKEVFDKNSID
jgi:hypothetical protein